MTQRAILAAGTALALLGAPMLSAGAWAACADETQALNQQIVTAETGATTQGDMPATEHQQEVLSGANETPGQTPEQAPEQMPEQMSNSPAAASDMPATEHQQQVLSGSGQTPEQTGDMPAGDAPPMETAAGATGAGATGDVEATSPHQRQVVREIDDETRDEASQLLAEAEALAAAGDEDGCMTKLEEARALLPAE
jgi:hypothetical protein